MCGICGVINFNNTVVRESPIREMMRIMKHRGPDDEGVFLEQNVGLGFVRLSIIDLSSAGHQPMISKDGRYVLVYNGEIYNYLELREELIRDGYLFNTKTDSEVLLNSYIKWGAECLQSFNGMWAFVIYDRLEKKIFAARDRYGVKPFYYLKTENCFAFSSEIPPLLSLFDKKPQPDYLSIFDYLVFNRTDQNERTFFEDVKKLQHGHLISFDLKSSTFDSKASIYKWYDLKERVSITEGFKNPEEFKQMLSSSIDLRLRSDVPVGVCLSGGLDSSSIVSVLLNEFDKRDLNTFSVVYKKGQSGDETEFINEYKYLVNKMFFTSPGATSLKNDLVEFVRALGEPIPSTSPYAQYKVMKLAQGKVVVTLDGQGADEELAGYHYFFGFYFKDLLIHGRLFSLCSEIFHYLTKHKSTTGILSFLYFLLPEHYRTKVRINKRGYLKSDFVNKYKRKNSIAGNLYGSMSLRNALLDHFEYKLEHLLKWEDRNSMWFSLEARVPFLDYRLVEKTLATSSNMKIRNGMTKHILRESMKGILPEKIRLRRDKIGFGTPQDEWFRTPEWQELINEVLSGTSFSERNLIEPAIALKMYRKHLGSDINCAQEIWKWIHLEFWFREFID